MFLSLHIRYGPMWETYYQNDPANFGGTAEQQKLVLGGSGALWAEFIDRYRERKHYKWA